MILGVIQVICAAILFLYWNKLNAKTKNQLSIYWIVICLYGLCWLPNWKFLDETVMLVFVVVILPTAIAGYFLYILNTIKNENTKKPHITL
jgi:phosphotransferase system  glucose/maltose/N-acetylglucosamine-specific IIC component